MPKKLYLANPYGFSLQQRELLLPPLVDALTTLGAEVWEPFARNNQIDTAQADWAYQIAQRDLADIAACDGIFAIVNGTPPDEGVMVELGYAIALGKPTFFLRDDFRRCSDSDVYPLNLMVFAGLPAQGWQRFYYTAIAQLPDQTKALLPWLNSENTTVSPHH